jgi:hypothetical protein
MARDGELRLAQVPDDTMLAGRTHERFDQLCLLKIPYVLRPLMFGLPRDTLRADDFSPGLPRPLGPKFSSVARRIAA